jgi:hypothetical protein
MSCGGFRRCDAVSRLSRESRRSQMFAGAAFLAVSRAGI